MQNGRWTHNVRMVNTSRTDNERTQNERWTHAKQTMNTHKTDAEQRKMELLNMILSANAMECKQTQMQQKPNTMES